MTTSIDDDLAHTLWIELMNRLDTDAQFYHTHYHDGWLMKYHGGNAPVRTMSIWQEGGPPVGITCHLSEGWVRFDEDAPPKEVLKLRLQF